MPNYFSNKAAFHTLSGISTEYYVHDTDDTSDPKYYGFIDPRGHWVILKETTSAGSFRYCRGKKDYTTNWANRASLSYGYFNEIT